MTRRSGGTPGGCYSLLQAWFEIMDSTTPERVLDMITDDFRLSILFSTGDKAAEFEGDRAGLEVYLAQREVSVLTHHLLQAPSWMTPSWCSARLAMPARSRRPSTRAPNCRRTARRCDAC